MPIIYPHKKLEFVVGIISHGGTIPETGGYYFVSMNDAKPTGNSEYTDITNTAQRCEVNQSTRVVTCTNSVRQATSPFNWITAASVANYLVIRW